MWTNSLFGLFQTKWYLTLTMIFGSFIAGATSEGGGAVAFPVMTLLFKITPQVARDFSLMIQSFGMTMAAYFIYILRIQILWKIIAQSIFFGTIGLIIGFSFFDGVIPGLYLKIFFTSLWLSFAYTLLKSNKSFHKTETEIQNIFTIPFLAIIGGVISSQLGSGIDIILFSFLTLNQKICLKIATPTSVVLMGIISIIGFFIKAIGITSPISQHAWEYLYVCLPVVIFGAPFGSYFINNKTQNFIKNILIIAIILQFIYALIILHLNFESIILSIATIICGLYTFKKMNKTI